MTHHRGLYDSLLTTSLAAALQELSPDVADLSDLSGDYSLSLSENGSCFSSQSTSGKESAHELRTRITRSVRLSFIGSHRIAPERIPRPAGDTSTAPETDGVSNCSCGSMRMLRIEFADPLRLRTRIPLTGIVLSLYGGSLRSHFRRTCLGTLASCEASSTAIDPPKHSLQFQGLPPL